MHPTRAGIEIAISYFIVLPPGTGNSENGPKSSVRTSLFPISSELPLLTTCSSDSRIPALIRNGLQEKKRSFFVVVGDRSKDAIVHCMSLFGSYAEKPLTSKEHWLLLASAD